MEQPQRPTLRFLTQIQYVCGASLLAPSDETVPETPRYVRRYHGHCVCGLVYFVSVASTHGTTTQRH